MGKFKKMILLVCAIFLVILMFNVLSNNFSYYLHSEHTKGVVISIDERSGIDALHGGRYVYPIVEFKNKKEKFIRFKSNESFLVGFIYPWNELQVGKSVDVLYNSQNPEDAKVYEIVNYWGIYLFILSASILVIIFVFIPKRFSK